MLNYFQVKNETEKAADIYIYDEIVFKKDAIDDWLDPTVVCPDDIIRQLQELEGKDLNIYINSPGGNVFAGFAILNILKRHQGYKTVHIDGVAASIASVIAMAGDKIVMPSNSYLMIHKPFIYMYGNADEFRKEADVLDQLEEGIVNSYKNKLQSGVTTETIKELMKAETWLSGEEAAQYFDVEVTAEMQYAAKADAKSYENFKNVPENLKTSIEAANVWKHEDGTGTGTAMPTAEEMKNEITRLVIKAL